MEAPDTRGAGGKATRTRGRSGTPGKLLGIVSSPLQLISKTVKVLVSSDRTSPSGTGAAATLSPPLQAQQAGPRASQQCTAFKVDDEPPSFSFPTLAGSDDSPPANVLLRTTPAAPPSQIRPAGTEATTSTHPGTSMPLSAGKDAINSWSPSKLASLNFFLNGAPQVKGAPAVAKPPAPAALPSVGPSQTSEGERPYHRLKALLRAGPGGVLSGAGGSVAGASIALGVGAGHPSTSRPPLGAGLRYNPYGRPNLGRPPRPGSSGGTQQALPRPSQVPLGAGSGSAELRSTGASVRTHAEPSTSMAVANAQLPPIDPRQLPPSGAPPRPPTAPGGVRLAPGQVAFSSGRTGTPLPKFGPVPASGAAQQQQQQQPAAHTPGGFRPLLGAVGSKRARDSPAASPLMASGIRNLSEFKRRRQALPQQPRSVLAGLSARTSRGDTTPGGSAGERTPVAAGIGGTAVVATPVPVTGGSAAVDAPVTETARKILETLENFSRAADQAANLGTPLGGGAKPGAHGAPRSSPISAGPLPGSFMPPLDRLDQNHFGASPAPTATPSLGTAAAGFVSGATPSPAGVSTQAGHTPGPRIALDFQSPAPTPTPQARQAPPPEPSLPAVTPAKAATTPLPLSPIAMPQALAATERTAPSSGSEVAAGTSTAPTSVAAVYSARPAAGAVHMGSGADAAANGSSADASVHSQDKTVAAYEFREPSAAADPRVRAANELAGRAVASSAAGADVPLFRFTAPTVGVSTSVAGSATSVPSAAPDSSRVLEEVQKAAATPLPDDDEEDEGLGVPTVAAPTFVEPRPPAQPFKPILPPSSKRVAFAETANERPAEKTQDAANKDAASTNATQPASPGGFFVANAGITPFRPLNSAAPSAEANEKAKPTSDRPVAFSFGAEPAATVMSTSAPSEPAKPQADSGKTAASADAPSLFSFGVQSCTVPASAASSAPATTAPSAPVFGLGGSAASFSFGAAPSTAPAVNGASAQPGSTGFTFGSAVLASSLFGASAPASRQASAAATAPASSAPAFPFSFGAPAEQPTTAMTSVLTPAPAPVAIPVTTAEASVAAPAVSSFGSAPSAAPQAGSGFTFGTAAAAPATAAPAFGFSAATAAPPSSFGASAPSASSASVPSFGSSQASEGFGGGFGGGSAPAATSFSFGAQASGAAMSSSGFGSQPASTTSSTFSFGAAAAAPTFGASAATPSFGSTPASQSMFGSSAPSFGGPASANPFGAAAPSFNAQPVQPAFGMQSTGPTSGFGAAAPAAAAAPTPSFGGFGAASGNSGGAPAASMFTFGGGAAPAFGSSQPAPAPMFGQASAPPPAFGAQAPQPQVPAPAFGGFGAAAPGGFGGFGAQSAPAFGGAPPPTSAGDAGGGFSLGAGDPKDGRKRVKARRHGH